jgi:hypothetical protein
MTLDMVILVFSGTCIVGFVDLKNYPAAMMALYWCATQVHYMKKLGMFL